MSQDNLNQDEANNRALGDAPQAAHRELADLLPAFSIGATDPEETEFVKAALAADPEAAQVLVQLSNLHRALLHSSAPRTPSPQLAERLRTAIQPQAAAPMRSGNVAWRDRLFAAKTQLTWPRLVLAGALALLIVLNAGTALRLLSLQTENESLASQLADQQEALALIAEEDVEVYTLSAVEEGGDAHASVRWKPNSNVAVLTAEGFPELQPDMAYQLWLIRDGQRTSGGLFTVDDAGAGLLLVVAPEPIDIFDSMGVTPEPAAGSPGPTSPPVVIGKL